MIGPVSILSLAAVSAAESTSSGKRGLTRGEPNYVWPAVMVGGSALTGAVVGAIPAYFIGKSGSSGAGLPIKHTDATERHALFASGCKQGSYQAASLATTGTVVAVPCKLCKAALHRTTPGDVNFAATKPDDSTDAKIKAICTLCAAGSYYSGSDNCTECPNETPFTEPGKLATASGTTAETPSKVCFAGCEPDIANQSDLVKDAKCVCGEGEKAVMCTKGKDNTCNISAAPKCEA